MLAINLTAPTKHACCSPNHMNFAELVIAAPIGGSSSVARPFVSVHFFVVYGASQQQERQSIPRKNRRCQEVQELLSNQGIGYSDEV